MARNPGVAVEIEGWKEFRRDLKRIDRDIDRELQREVRGAAQSVARGASATAPRKTGAMAAVYRGTARGTRGIVRNPLFYARFIEFGSHPRGSSTFIPGQNVIGRALEQQENEVVDRIDKAMDRAAVKAGWR